MLISDWSSDVCSSDLTTWCSCPTAASTARRGGSWRRCGKAEPLHKICRFSASLDSEKTPASCLVRSRESPRPDGPGVTYRPSGRMSAGNRRSEEHTSELQSLMRISYAVLRLKKKKTNRQK